MSDSPICIGSVFVNPMADLPNTTIYIIVDCIDNYFEIMSSIGEKLRFSRQILQGFVDDNFIILL